MTIIRSMYYLSLLSLWRRPRGFSVTLVVGTSSDLCVVDMLNANGGEVALELPFATRPKRFYAMLADMVDMLTEDPFRETGLVLIKHARAPE